MSKLNPRRTQEIVVKVPLKQLLWLMEVSDETSSTLSPHSVDAVIICAIQEMMDSDTDWPAKWHKEVRNFYIGAKVNHDKGKIQEN